MNSQSAQCTLVHSLIGGVFLPIIGETNSNCREGRYNLFIKSMSAMPVGQ